MSNYCTGIFVGYRIRYFPTELNRTEQSQLKWSLCLTPTKEYPSAFGAGLLDDGSSIIHGIYDNNETTASMTEYIGNVPTYKYECKLIVQNASVIIRLHGTWKSLIDDNIFGALVLICEPDIKSDFFSGLWIGQAIPDPSLSAFHLPINPIRWCVGVIRLDSDNWQMFGSGYFDDSADIEDQPLLFFTLTGQGSLNRMKVVKKYISAECTVEYQGKFVQNDHNTYNFMGDWSNGMAGSYGTFNTEHWQLDPAVLYRVDICICEVCNSIIHPGNSRWSCFPCQFSVCPCCNLNSIAINHHHELVPSILPTQRVASGKSCRELIESAFKTFNNSTFLIFHNKNNRQLVRMTYEQVSIYCRKLMNYWRPFLGLTNDNNRPTILFIAKTSPAYICCLFAGLLCQAVLVPVSGSLSIEALEDVIMKNNPHIVVVGEEYIEKINQILSGNNERLLMIVQSNEEQFGTAKSKYQGWTSFSTAVKVGEQINNDEAHVCELSTSTLSAILSTSGSTGFPKGALFTEDLLVPNDTFTLISPFIRIDYQSFDPVLLLSMMNTIRYGTIRGITNVNDMWDDIQEIRPTSLGFPPSLWNALHKMYKATKQSLGGRVVVGTTGGGSISPSVLSFFRNQLKIDLADIYGCRECGNIARNGIIYPGIDLKFLPIIEMNLNGINEGEICVHSPRMISGYQGIENTSAFIIIDNKRYYRTGDIGRLEGKVLKLIDRSGTMIKNSQGEWIAPVKIENIIEQLEEVSMAFVIGHSSSSYIAVIVCPSSRFSTINEIDLMNLIRFHCSQCLLSGPEIPQRVYIEREITWNEQNGFMKEKKARQALLKHYSQIKMSLFTQTSVEQHQEMHQFSDEFIQILESILRRPFKELIVNDSTCIEVGADSLSISLLCQIFQGRGINLTPSIAYSLSLKCLDQMLKNPHMLPNVMVESINWNSEMVLSDSLRSSILHAYSAIKKNILLTGATGFLGPLILSEILENTDSTTIIYCLIRAHDEEHAKTRLETCLQKSQREHSIDWKRIRCLTGNISKSNLGLSLSDYKRLLSEIGFVYHNASWVHLEMPYKTLKPYNVFGAFHCLEFALKCQARFIYTSSIAALPTSLSAYDHHGWVKLTADEINKKDGYGQTKVVVEQCLREVSDLGADIVVIRPGTISADRQSGYSNVNDFINILLRTQLEMQITVDNSNVHLHWAPVDYCAKAIVALGMSTASRGKCFDIVGDGINISLVHKTLFNKFTNLKLRTISQNDWHDYIMKNLDENSRAWPLKNRIASMLLFTEGNSKKNTGVNVQTKITREFLEKECNLPWFVISEDHIHKSIDYMMKENFFTVN